MSQWFNHWLDNYNYLIFIYILIHLLAGIASKYWLVIIYVLFFFLSVLYFFLSKFLGKLSKGKGNSLITLKVLIKISLLTLKGSTIVPVKSYNWNGVKNIFYFAYINIQKKNRKHVCDKYVFIHTVLVLNFRVSQAYFKT